MRAADRSRIRTFGRAFGPIEWHDDPLDLIFDEETREIQPPLDHVNDAWRGYRPAFGQRMPTKAQWRWWPLRILSDESLRVTTVHTFGCPYGATECPAPALPAGGGHHVGCFERAEREDRYAEERPLFGI